MAAIRAITIILLVRRERAHASDFNAALHEHQQYLRRRVRAPELRHSPPARDTNEKGS